jgi:hypothetical protein
MGKETYIYNSNMEPVDAAPSDLTSGDISAVHIRSNVICIYLTSDGEKKVKREKI